MASTSITSQTTVYLPNVLHYESNYPTLLFRIEAFLNGQNSYGFVDGSYDHIHVLHNMLLVLMVPLVLFLLIMLPGKLRIKA